jgi:hypothetical protein
MGVPLKGFHRADDEVDSHKFIICGAQFSRDSFF